MGASSGALLDAWRGPTRIATAGASLLPDGRARRSGAQRESSRAPRCCNLGLTFLSYNVWSGWSSSRAGTCGFHRGVTRITDTTLDWDRIARWTADIAAGDVTAITAIFAAHGAAAPGLAWNPQPEQFDAAAL